MIIEIFDKDEREHNTFFILNVFDGELKDNTIQEIKNAIDRVHQIDEYSVMDLESELDKIQKIANSDQKTFSYLYSCVDEKMKDKIELGF